MTEHNIVSVSGGKDSTALLLLAIVREAPNMQAVFADTGHEHPQTYDYIDYLAQATGVSIRRVQADFSHDFERKRQYISTKWRQQEVDEKIVLAALDVLHPTGIPFLDACLVAGRMPSPLGKFCTRQLKIEPLTEQVMLPLLDGTRMVLSWQGVRADESENRRWLPECDEVGGGLFNYRPILRWKADDCFDAHRFMGIKPNPLYLQGCSRVGCMPCIHATKDEVLNISKRWPEHSWRVSEWERLVAMASKGTSPVTFFNHGKKGGMTMIEAIEWSKTSRGGRQLDFLRIQNDGPLCSSNYGLCE
jgi:3'-phosphoadenosine 5'-phosphosulfate sulfotransferase (PAPS reductase)/FAD synthetase